MSWTTYASPSELSTITQSVNLPDMVNVVTPLVGMCTAAAQPSSVRANGCAGCDKLANELPPEAAAKLGSSACEVRNTNAVCALTAANTTNGRSCAALKDAAACDSADFCRWDATSGLCGSASYGACNQGCLDGSCMCGGRSAVPLLQRANKDTHTTRLRHRLRMHTHRRFELFRAPRPTVGVLTLVPGALRVLNRRLQLLGQARLDRRQ